MSKMHCALERYLFKEINYPKCDHILLINTHVFLFLDYGMADVLNIYIQRGWFRMFDDILVHVNKIYHMQVFYIFLPIQ